MEAAAPKVVENLWRARAGVAVRRRVQAVAQSVARTRAVRLRGDTERGRWAAPTPADQERLWAAVAVKALAMARPRPAAALRVTAPRPKKERARARGERRLVMRGLRRCGDVSPTAGEGQGRGWWSPGRPWWWFERLPQLMRVGLRGGLRPTPQTGGHCVARLPSTHSRKRRSGSLALRARRRDPSRR